MSLKIEINDETQQAFKKWRWGIVGFCVVLLMFLMFKAGVLFSCQDGYLQGNVCVQPKVVDMVQVCEYSNIGCFQTCQDVIITDREEFYNSFNTAYEKNTDYNIRG